MAKRGPRPCEDSDGNTIWENVVYDCGHFPDQLGDMDEHEYEQHKQFLMRHQKPIGDKGYFGTCRYPSGRFNYRWRKELVDGTGLISTPVEGLAMVLGDKG